MKAICCAALLALCLPATAFADDPTPLAQATVAAPNPASAPESTPTPIALPTPTVAPESSPVPVTKEGSSSGSVETTGPPTVGIAPTPASENHVVPTPQVAQPQGVSPTSTPVAPSSSSGPATPPQGASASSVPSGTTSDTSLLTGVTGSAFSFQAPVQLQCAKKSYPIAQPFLQSPFRGWTDINSFMDHDRPDYEVDGKMVLANGLDATGADGQASDVFPAYWLPTLRQYINYDGHNGYDFGISYQPVYAAAAGTVEFAGWNGPTESSGYGQMVLINHHNGYVTLYGHLSRLEVAGGDKVRAGQEIGISGSTGNSTGPHLHFSVFHNCQVTDPYGWTGAGTDPLQQFNREKAAYLWLPNEDPLVLNPPPNWPTYPVGIKLPAALQQAAPEQFPAADRLLLLRLPISRSLHTVTAGAAMAATEALVTHESESLLPALKHLAAKHLITNYEVIPAAAAVWVRGTATAQQLEALPGVASLSGVQAKDLLAAQTDVAHSVLIQVANQSAPALWPVGFRSALHAWRPTATVLNGQALIAGFALPGARVSVTLTRRGIPIGSTVVGADAQDGGFVATVHNSAGAPIQTESNDVLHVASGGRRAAVRIATFSLKARSRSLRGRARSGATIAVTVLGATRAWSGVTVANRRGNYKFRPPFQLPAGSMAVASVVDSAGDEEAASAFVPGLDLASGSGEIGGWAVSKRPVLTLWRHRSELFRAQVTPASDGSFSVRLPTGTILRRGDQIEVATAHHDRFVSIPGLALSLGKPRNGSVTIASFPHALTWLTGPRGTEQPVRLAASGRATVPTIGLRPGMTLSARMILRRGDVVRWSIRVPGRAVGTNGEHALPNPQ